MMLIISIINATAQGEMNVSYKSYIVSIVRFIILLSYMIPISLKLFLILGRAGYGHKITNDKEIEGTVVKNETIVDELGKI